jgi:antitoxin component of RelBE/YafQ-DinJ toxin-antitoxin module
MLAFVVVKKAILNLRLDPNVRDEFALAARLRGASMSGLLHQFIVRTIREEKAEYPREFTAIRPATQDMALIGSSDIDPDDKNAIREKLDESKEDPE